MKIESKIGQAAHSDRKIFEFVSNFDNFKDLLPANKISEWESSQDRCSFRVDPLGKIGLLIVEKEAWKLIKIESDPGFSSHQFTLWIQLKAVSEKDTRIRITIEPRVNKMLQPMIKGPLQKLANGIVDRMESYSY